MDSSSSTGFHIRNRIPDTAQMNQENAAPGMNAAGARSGPSMDPFGDLSNFMALQQGSGKASEKPVTPVKRQHSAPASAKKEPKESIGYLAALQGGRARQKNKAATTGKKEVKDGEERVKVVVRARPEIQEDRENFLSPEDLTPCVKIPGDGTPSVTLDRYGQGYEERTFGFDHVLPQDMTQQDTFNVVAKDIVSDVLAGFNGTVMAYGQTGTGKTYTIFGREQDWIGQKPTQAMIDPNDPDGGLLYTEAPRINMNPGMGIVPRSICEIFDYVEKHAFDTEFFVSVSLIQLYMENLVDLLDPRKQNLHIREDPKTGIFVDDLTQLVVHNREDALELIREGSQNRAVHQTSMNKVSTRSHVILLVTVEQRPLAGQGSERDTTVKRGVLTIVDLAGSERVGKSGSEGLRLEEAKRINKSLSALGNCVAALASGNRHHTPFRDSKLTRLLTDSLGGNSKTCLVATVGPCSSNYDENYSTLMFATRAMSVQNHARVNEVVDFKELSASLQKTLENLRSENRELLERNEYLEEERAVLEQELALAKRQLAIGASVVADTAAPMGLPSTPATSAGNMTTSTPAMTDAHAAAQWQQRERELVSKFQLVISHMQREIAAQHSIVEQVAGSMLAIPGMKDALLEEAKKGV